MMKKNNKTNIFFWGGEDMQLEISPPHIVPPMVGGEFTPYPKLENETLVKV